MTDAASSAADNERDASACVVCAAPLQADAQADCYRCGGYFHLALTTSSEVEDCGQVWLDDEVLALQFACSRCLEEQINEQDAPTDAPQRPPSRAIRAEPGVSAQDIARRRRGR